MIRDFASSSDDRTVEADVLVVGAGTVGLVIATLLSRKGMRVAVVESGEFHQFGEQHLLNEVVQLGSPYSGAQKGRFRCLGGTSTRWGGAMIPFMAQDLDVVPGWDARWPVGVECFAKYTNAVERLFGLAGTPYEAPKILGSAAGVDATFSPLLAKWPDFASRNVATLLRQEIERSDGPEIWLGATVVDFILQADGRFSAAVSKNMNGRSLRIGARHAIVAAGAIESTRLLLLMDLRHDERIFKPHSVLGHYFYDHISLQTADVQVDDARALNRIIGFRFEGRTMRNLRFAPTAIFRKKNDLPNAFLHISFTSDFPSGFDALRAILRRRQEGRVPSGSDLAMLASSLPWLARAVWWRLAKKRLLFPPQCVFHLNTVVEQQPLSRNRIALSSERKDVLGVPLATIDWQIGDADARHVIALTEHFTRFWETSVLAPLARLKIKPGLALMDRLADEGGIYHPGGTTRMGGAPARQSSIRIYRPLLCRI